jgi:hypothetical protein
LGYSSIDNFDEKVWKYTVGILKHMLGIKEQQNKNNIKKEKIMEKSKLKQKQYVITLSEAILVQKKFIPKGATLIVTPPKPKQEKVQQKIKSTINEDYNGWTNWETWQVNLWVGDMATEENIKRWTPDMVEDYTWELYPNGTPDMSSAREYKKVNWKELAKYWSM